jgi:hypothetical protein
MSAKSITSLLDATSNSFAVFNYIADNSIIGNCGRNRLRRRLSRVNGASVAYIEQA